MITINNILSGAIGGIIVFLFSHVVASFQDKKTYQKQEKTTREELDQNIEYIKNMEEIFNSTNPLDLLDFSHFCNMISLEAWNNSKSQISKNNISIYNKLKIINKKIFLLSKAKVDRDLAEHYIKDALKEYKEMQNNRCTR